jgi:hypothetical protein
MRALVALLAAAALCSCAHPSPGPHLQRLHDGDGAALVVPRLSPDPKSPPSFHACLFEPAPREEPKPPKGRGRDERAGAAFAFARAALYRLCEARANGDITEEQYAALFRQTVERAFAAANVDVEIARLKERDAGRSELHRARRDLDGARRRLEEARASRQAAEEALAAAKAEKAPRERLEKLEADLAAREKELRKAGERLDDARARARAAEEALFAGAPGPHPPRPPAPSAGPAAPAGPPPAPR